MDYTTLGRTGLKVSVAGLGCGGFSRLGLAIGKSEAETVSLIRTALDLGVNLLDTAPAYGTEEVVGKAVAGLPRDNVVVATKVGVERGDQRATPADMVASLDASLRRLGLDHVDIVEFHGVGPDLYEYILVEAVPVMLRERERGKFRFLGVTETPPRDFHHRMLQRAFADDCWDVTMLGYNLMHQNARQLVFPGTRRRGIGTLLMFAVRNIFARPQLLKAKLEELAARGEVPREIADEAEPLGFLVHPGGAEGLTDAAYRFVRHTPGVDVVLFGTGDVGHLRSNIASILGPPLPEPDLEKLRNLFGGLVGIGLERPPQRAAAKP